MEKALKNKVQRVLRLCAILTFISSCVVILIGSALSSLNNEVKILERYLELAADVKPNFEESLTLYTETTQNAIEFVHELRPEGEDEYIEFIDELEGIANGMDLDMNLQSVDNSLPAANISSNSIEYKIDFYGSRYDLTEFLEELESMNYYVHVLDFEYESLSFAAEQEKETPNITINIRLYVK